jgi:S-disulfanyl-L-cysteine oxidoreductase SoxD
VTFTRPRSIHATAFAVVALIGMAGWHVSSSAQAPARQTSPGARSAPAFTSAQAALGLTAYRASCASCHGENLDDGAFGPPLKGVTFIQKYGGRSVAPLYTVSATRMPTTAPGSLAPAVYAQIVAYLLQQNAIIAGTEHRPPPNGSDGAAPGTRTASAR